MTGLRDDGHSHVDPDGLMEFSVVFTDRSLNHMSKKFQQVMRDISDIACEVYGADGVALVPGGGTFAMESVARQFARDANALIVRNGWFSFRWTQILDAADFDAEAQVQAARPDGNQPRPAYAPAPIEDVVTEIARTRPAVVFAPHVETSAGLILPDDYIAALADAVHEVGGLMVLDSIASGAIWVDMRALGVDVLISAPQKGWSASPAAGLVMFSGRGLERLEATTSDSFALDLKKWRAIMKAYEDGGHAYHATLPTDALVTLRDAMVETREMGFEAAREAQWDLGRKIRAALAERGIRSVAAEGYAAPGVVVSYTDDPDIRSGRKFAEKGMQIASGVPLQVGEGPEFSTFRLGLFGLDKLKDVDGTVARLTKVLDEVLAG
ncbi:MULTISPECIES: aminotransferase class V-fold PLP-dependent enzyme [unclassified Paracoccus (in: a-proteobacteria)]|uniref:aminotransferase class V-fold PLP-dependent enzyme n=1 Tax=unclassified Paracoccus (in: a-proteobacteria) TaxID=2688777 RepID=UPI00160408E5|nr:MULTISPECIES: aminotransferase class V-fold PLP-dependent enzyme [unclassified Paracoccus (in: a-proteobacteria)]MBB1491968.1 alanine--glyoxylate aminotransferase family protein [Paracoccus sp. MC1854]MBB1498169.1 alanine--glyoxylate aminotransferase family protein [Paracoccus sp. MC1862]QQO45667.1 alanine--glyoxylate aminotransferase family protein [Paracoccus sp. MC1862]